jgi:hypothetical protein
VKEAVTLTVLALDILGNLTQIGLFFCVASPKLTKASTIRTSAVAVMGDFSKETLPM